VRIIGIGNEDRGDDAAGLLAVRCLRARLPAGVEVIESDGEPTRLLDLLAGTRRVMIVDAAGPGECPGGVRRLPAPAAGRARIPASTHNLGLPEALALGAALGVTPAVTIYTIEGMSFEPGGDVSSEVQRGAREAADSILAELNDGRLH
jgi:hydrogenase maturation protease